MFYATYKNIGYSEIAEFETEQQRDEWVSFKDPFSVECGTTHENCFIERITMNADRAQKRIPHMVKTRDMIYPDINWYIN